MKTEVKIIEVQEKLTKEGKPYKIVYLVISIDNDRFVRKFYLF